VKSLLFVFLALVAVHWALHRGTPQRGPLKALAGWFGAHPDGGGV